VGVGATFGNRQLVCEMFDMVRGGRIHPPEPTRYPLEQAGTALTAMLERGTAGKVALIP